jgi:hypothetical protein
MSQDERMKLQDDEYRKKIRDFFYQDKLQKLEEDGNFEGAYNLEKEYLGKNGFKLQRCRYLEEKFFDQRM